MSEQPDELLISRAIDGDATPKQWDDLMARGDSQPELWRRLAEALRDQAAVARAVNASLAVAERVEAPLALARPAPPPARARLRLRAWGGWAVAAILALTWAVAPPRPAPHAAQQVADLLPKAPAADLFRAYLDRGRQEDLVVGEVPEKIVVDSRQAPSGEGYELLYLRQILERAVVPDLYRFTGEDELGRPVLVRFEQPARGPM